MKSKRKIKEIKEKTIHGTIQLITREMGMKVIAISGQLLLVKLLSPASFGVFAILSFLLSTIEIFTDIGLSLTIIQRKKEPTQLQLSTIFFTKLILTLLAIVVLNISSQFIHLVYHQFGQAEILMLRILSLTLLIKPLQTIISAVLERNLRYRDIAIIDLSGMVSYYFVAILLASFGFNIWSFIWAVVAMTIAETLVTFSFKPWLPRLTFNLKSIRDFLDIGKFFQLGFFLTIFRSAVIPVIGGTRLPFSDTGLLDWSFNISSLPRVFIDNLGRVSFSSFSRLQDNKPNIKTSLEQAFKLISVTATLIIPITIIFGRDFIHFFLNDKWLPALPALYWYVGSIFFLNGVGLLGQALLAIGKIKQLLFFGTTITIIEIIISYLLLLKYGFTGISIGFFISNLLLFVTYIFICHKEKVYVNFLGITVKNLIIFGVTFLISHFVNVFMPSSFVFFVLKLLIVTATYTLLVVAISPDAFMLILKLVKKTVKKGELSS